MDRLQKLNGGGKPLSARSKYGNLATNQQQQQQEHVQGDDLQQHPAVEGRQKLLVKQLHEIRRFDSGDYFSGHIPEEEIVAHSAKYQKEVEEQTRVAEARQQQQTHQPPAVAYRNMDTCERRKRWDSADYNMVQDRRVHKPVPQAKEKLKASVSSKDVARKLLMSKRSGAPSGLGANRGSRATPQPAPATTSKYDKMSDKSARQVLLRRKLKEKPNLQRWDSGEYFSLALKAQQMTEDEGDDDDDDDDELADTPSPDAADRGLPTSSEPPSTPPSTTTGSNPGAGRAVLLNRKLREVKRFDSGDYFRGIKTQDIVSPINTGTEAFDDDYDSMSTDTVSSQTEAPATQSTNEVPATAARLRGHAGSKAVAQRLIRDSSRHKRWDSADYSMAKMTSPINDGSQKQTSGLGGVPGSGSGLKRNERRMEKYGKLSAKPKYQLPQ